MMYALWKKKVKDSDYQKISLEIFGKLLKQSKNLKIKQKYLKVYIQQNFKNLEVEASRSRREKGTNGKWG